MNKFGDVEVDVVDLIVVGDVVMLGDLVMLGDVGVYVMCMVRVGMVVLVVL